MASTSNLCPWAAGRYVSKVTLTMVAAAMEGVSSSGLTHVARESCGARALLSRKEKRKGRKKVKRSEKRQQAAEQARQEEELGLKDPRVQVQEERALDQERLEHELQERLWLQREKEIQEEADRKRLEAEAAAEEDANAWDYVEEGPAEIIWEGNEIIVRKQKVKVPKSRIEKVESTEDDRPVSNPLLPESLYCKPVSSSLPSQSAAYEDHKKLAHSTILNSENNPNFGTEQDKTHCPFHIKTGVCRFGANCSRAHVYPDKSCTLLIKNMYHGPGLPMEHDEGLEHTDEEVAQSYRDFFEDVHGEFLKHGELVNFKVCRNESSHLRGNVYAQFESVESAIAAYHAINGRFFAGKQITCEFVVVTRWRAALCGEYMRSHHRVCSHGTACNFLHCFKNPRGLYDWADWDNPPPRSHLGKGHSRGNSNKDVSYQDRDNYRRSQRSHNENLTNKNRRSDQSHGKRASRYQDYHCKSSSEESLLEEKARSRKKSRHRSSRRYQDHYGSSSEETLSEEKGRSLKKRQHRISERVEDHQTERKVNRKHRRRSRSRDRSEREHKERITGRESTRPRWRGRSTSHESSESVVSSDRESVCKTRRRRKSRRDRGRGDERYRPRSRSLKRREAAAVTSADEGINITEKQSICVQWLTVQLAKVPCFVIGFYRIIGLQCGDFNPCAGRTIRCACWRALPANFTERSYSRSWFYPPKFCSQGITASHSNAVA
ncbi:hypothetical protein GOP47_0020589 [Adiantum capillus-veneris]|uniref:Zinc finger CCCH domain-containing protein 5 n=1 Tax=Adiantum capillus-veneris TaxID=13818 RepID=A0A9D4U9E2_ADICA|nr:hypothetical protein GOP47_0020589 [Adiantum capillus-veneris]